MIKNEIIDFVKSQRSLHLYKNAQEAFIDVLDHLSNEQFEKVKIT